jgi:membrane-associated phospholipid phosphatase
VPKTRFILAAALAIAASLLLDRWTFEHVVYSRTLDEDWGRLLRVMGFLPTWGAAALALWLHERGVVAGAGRRALLLIGSPVVAGIAAEILKLTFRRGRPLVADGDYVFRPFTERPFSTGGLALPSSHAMVAFGAAAMLAYLFPRARWVWLSLAIGCGLTRILSQAHYLSDVVVAAIAAFATSAWLWRKYGSASSAPSASSA